MSDQPEQPNYPEYQQQTQQQYQQYQPPAPPKKGGAGKWIALGGCGCLFFLAVICGVVFLVFQMTKAPMKAVNDQLTAIRNNNLEQAYNDCSAGFKQETTKQDFVNYIESYPFFKTSKEFSSSNRKTENGVTTLDGNVESTDGTKHPVEYKVIKESDVYKVHYINVKEAAQARPVEPAPTTTTESEETTDNNQESGETSQPEIFGIHVDKSQSGETVTVKVTFQVKSFNNTESGGNFSLNLVQDLATDGPDGNKVGSLSADAIKTLTETGRAEYTSADFTNTLTIPTSYPHGTYTVHLRVHDQIGGGTAENSATFEFP